MVKILFIIFKFNLNFKTMKKNIKIISFFLLLVFEKGFAQSILITPGNNQPAINATSISGGVLIPKVNLTSLTSASPVVSPAEGTLVYNLNAAVLGIFKGFYYWTGSAWTQLGIASSALSGASPISIVSNVVKLNSGTATGQLITWDGVNWINTNPKPAINQTNMQPYLALNYCIALQGIFPSRNGADPFLGEIQLFGFNFDPIGFAFCNGQLLPITQNSALFALLGTIYGGNGTTNFALPDLRGRVPIHFGQGPGLTNRLQGEKSGVESFMITDKY
jgi:microcystin-dependent protein